jgi:hypothetical protein
MASLAQWFFAEGHPIDWPRTQHSVAISKCTAPNWRLPSSQGEKSTGHFLHKTEKPAKMAGALTSALPS